MTPEQIVESLRDELAKLAQALPDTAESAAVYQLDAEEETSDAG
jgi:hypothetical protein